MNVFEGKRSVMLFLQKKLPNENPILFSWKTSHAFFMKKHLLKKASKTFRLKV